MPLPPIGMATVKQRSSLSAFEFDAFHAIRRVGFCWHAAVALRRVLPSKEIYDATHYAIDAVYSILDMQHIAGDYYAAALAFRRYTRNAYSALFFFFDSGWHIASITSFSTLKSLVLNFSRWLFCLPRLYEAFGFDYTSHQRSAFYRVTRYHMRADGRGRCHDDDDSFSRIIRRRVSFFVALLNFTVTILPPADGA